MPFPIRTPRINNNDDIVRLSAVFAKPGARIAAGDPVCEIETDKATFTVEAEQPGYFLKCLHEVGSSVEVGTILVWMGESETDAAPDAAVPSQGPTRAAEPTLKAALLLKTYGLTANQVPSSSDRLSAAEVETYIAAKGLRPPSRTQTAPKAELPGPEVAAAEESLNAKERGMLRTVLWHRDEAATGYVEVVCDTAAWDEYAARFQKQHNLMMNPLLGLMAYQLVKLRELNPKYNATIHGERKLLYEPVNVGFTVQGGDSLYLVVISDAQKMSARDFVQRLTQLQKQAMKNKLEPADTTGATIGFTSMARWGVLRHQPILPPYTSLMVAHAAPAPGEHFAALGASYDHRILSGADAVMALNFLKEPPSEPEPREDAVEVATQGSPTH